MSSYIIDISRLLERLNLGLRPTGIDRVIVSYITYFKEYSLAAFFYKNQLFIFNKKASLEYFDIIIKSSTKNITWISFKNIIFNQQKKTTDAYFLNLSHTLLDNHNYLKKIKKYKCIFFIHDLIPITHSEYCRSGEKQRHEKRIKNAMNIASGIIVNSYQTLTTLTNYLKKTNTACPPIINAHLGQTNFPKNNSYTLSGDKKYFIIIGTIEPRKNIWFILNLWKEIIERLSNDAPYLVIIGKRGWECENVIDLLERCEIIKSRIIEISSAKDDELQNWLRNSIALLFPSFIEGYGIPLIEAISQKVPVIASNLPIFHEIVGNTPDYIHPLDGPKWIDTIINYTNDNSLLRNKQIERLQTFNLPTWDEHFKKVENFLSTI